jgi:hypothetical protein
LQNWRLVHITKRYEIHGLSAEETVGFLASLPEKERENWFAWQPGSPQWQKASDYPELAAIPTMAPWWFAEQPVAQIALPPEFPNFPPPPPPSVIAQAPAPIEAEPAPMQAEPTLMETMPTLVDTEYALMESKPAQTSDILSVATRSDFIKTAPVNVPPSIEEPTHSNEEQPSSIRRLFKNPRKEPRVDLRLKVVVTEGTNSFRSYSVNISLGGLLLEKKVPWSLSGKSCQVFLTNETSAEAIEFTARVLSSAADPFRLAFEDCNPDYLGVLQKWMGIADSALGKKAS